VWDRDRLTLLNSGGRFIGDVVDGVDFADLIGDAAGDFV